MYLQLKLRTLGFQRLEDSAHEEAAQEDFIWDQIAYFPGDLGVEGGQMDVDATKQAWST
jgi:hypothetical protein